MSKHIAIIGGGPSGLMAAELLAERQHFVTVYDRMPSVGRKLLMAGRGGLNLTHSEPFASFLTRYGAAEAWLAPKIAAFPPDALRAWCEGLGELTIVGSSGRVFPRQMKAAPLLRAWLRRLAALGVRFALSHRWQGFAGQALRFSDASGHVLDVTPDATLLALGGASWPRLGSDGAWVSLLQEQGVSVTPLRPANGGFVVPWSPHLARFAGTPLKPVSLTHDGVTRQGEAMITQDGLEGGLIYAFSAALRGSIEAQGHAALLLDTRPAMTLDALTQRLQRPRGNQSLSGFLRRAGFSPLVIALLRETTPELARLVPEAIAARLKALPLTVTKNAGLTRAISSAGGVATHALDDHGMLRARPGVFVAGEMVDWEAPTGGYLLQACFSTAAAAAEGMLRYLYSH